jgi:DNA-binding transcriptional MerR regulator
MDIELLTIEQVAERTGLSAYTLRYYERIGLLDPVGRATSGHRRYATKDLAWIEFLTRLRATGMPIRHMQEFATLRRLGNTTIAKRRALLEAHQQMVQTHIEELQRNLEAINQKIETYHQMEENYGNDSRYHTL